MHGMEMPDATVLHSDLPEPADVDGYADMVVPDRGIVVGPLAAVT
jgi:hypothetical protein